MANSSSLITVLSGDIVKSTDLTATQLSAARDKIEEFAHRFEGLNHQQLILGPDFFSGDGWQLVCLSPELALRCAIYIRSGLIQSCNCDTRISIGIGKTGQIRSDKISLSDGEAFILSGRGLKSLTIYNDLAINLPDQAKQLSEWVETAAEFCNEIIRGWTRRQAEIVNIACHAQYLTHEEIGERLSPPVSKQSVTKVLSSAHWRPISRMIELFEKTDWQKVLGNAA